MAIIQLLRPRAAYFDAPCTPALVGEHPARCGHTAAPPHRFLRPLLPAAAALCAHSSTGAGAAQPSGPMGRGRASRTTSCGWHTADGKGSVGGECLLLRGFAGSMQDRTAHSAAATVTTCPVAGPPRLPWPRIRLIARCSCCLCLPAERLLPGHFATLHNAGSCQRLPPSTCRLQTRPSPGSAGATLPRWQVAADSTLAHSAHHAADENSTGLLLLITPDLRDLPIKTCTCTRHTLSPEKGHLCQQQVQPCVGGDSAGDGTNKDHTCGH